MSVHWRCPLNSRCPLYRASVNRGSTVYDLLTINNPDYISKIYPNELELKQTTEGHGMSSYLDLNIFTTDLYDKREAFNFTIVNYPHMDSNIPSKPAYGVFISQLIR